MDEQNLESIKHHLQNEEVQERIRQNVLRCRSLITVSIGEVVKLLNLGENQLRKWEIRGLLQPQKIGSHRHYSLQDLEKLVVIQELINNRYPPRVIPVDIDSVWHTISPQVSLQSQKEQERLAAGFEDSKKIHPSINQLIEHAQKEIFWRFYVSHIMRLVLALICENLPQYNNAGLILPLRPDTDSRVIHKLEDLPEVGEALVGWLAQSGSFYTLVTARPSLDDREEYSIYKLQDLENNVAKDDALEHNILLLIDERLRPPTLERVAVNTIRRVLAPIYEDIEATRASFGPGTREILDAFNHLNNHEEDSILTGLANMIVRLGTSNEQASWQFCCILLPDNTALPLQQRSLVVRAQSEHSPHKIGDTSVLPNEPAVSVSLRAYQSGQIIYRSEVYEEDTTIAYRELEKPGSVIAVPVGGENGAPTAVLYIVSKDAHAFTRDDQRMLRFISKAVEEAILTYNIRLQTSSKLNDTILYPDVTDTFFARATENAFVEDIENLLSDIQMSENYEEEIDKDIVSSTKEEISLQAEQTINDGLSLIVIDIDKQSQLANIYGDQFTRNLVKVVSSRLKPEVLRIFADSSRYNLYYICADRFYLVIRNLAIEEARKKADKIRRRMDSTVEVSILYPMNQEKRFIGSDESQVVPVSVHVGVCFYKYEKLRSLLKRYSAPSAVGRVRALINRDIERSLDEGRIEKGNVVISWNIGPDPQKRKFIRWSPE